MFVLFSFVFGFLCFTEGKYVFNKQGIQELALRTLFEKIFKFLISKSGISRNLLVSLPRIKRDWLAVKLNNLSEPLSSAQG